MLNYSLLHPPLLAALAAAGHSSRILIADGNYPHSTGANPAATLIHLNLRPGMVSVDDVLETLLEAVPLEAAAVMDPTEGGVVEAHQGYRTMLGANVPVEVIERFSFYEASRGPDVAVVIATADQRLYANLLLTIGVRH